MYSVLLQAGDCLFIPAYYFFHIQGFKRMVNSLGTPMIPTVEELKVPKVFEDDEEEELEEAAKEDYDVAMATTVSMRFEHNSDILKTFFEAIEDGIIT